MAGFDYFEVFLYVLPILEIILIHLFFRPYLQYENRFKLSITEVTIPVLLVGIHVLSVRLLTFSVLPHFFFVCFLIGILATFYFERTEKSYSVKKIVTIFLKIAFLIGFISYYIIVIGRIIQVLRG